MSSRRYDVEEIKSLLTQERNIVRVLEALYNGEATFDRQTNTYRLADIRGGEGRSCQIKISGQYAGRFIDFNPSCSREKGSLIDAVMEVRGCDFVGAITYLGELLGAEPRLQSVATSAKRPEPATRSQDTAPINPDSHQRMQRALERCPEAIAYLQGRGLTSKTIARFGLGIAQAYPPRAPVEEQVTGAIASPVIDRGGHFLSRTPKTTVPGFTTNPRDDKGWSTGSPLTYWNGSARGKTVLFVAEGMKDLWRLSQEIEGTSLDSRMAIISSTHGSGIPEEWRDSDFWKPWDAVYLGHDNDAAGERMTQRIREYAFRDIRRLEVPRSEGKDWTDFFQNGGTLAQFEEMIDKAPSLGLRLPEPSPNRPLEEDDDGTYEIERININGAFVGGHMYYPFRVRETRTESQWVTELDGTRHKQSLKVHARLTQVVRSDGIVLTPREMPAPAGTPDDSRIVALEDGTIVSAVPNPEDYSTWRYSSIRQYIDNVQAGRPAHRPLGEIVDELLEYLRTLTWLPYESDYALLAGYVLLSYVFNAFDAIPMILINGEKGSGKSTTAEGIADLSYNGHVLGAGSEKAMIRFVDQARGLVVLDDLEKVGRRNGSDVSEFSDVNQMLKVSYNKATGVKTVVDKNGNNQRLMFYGPKVITNISGLDPVNESRTYTVFCRPMPVEVARSGQITGLNREISHELRQELHAWGMSNALAANTAYRKRMASLGDRAKQIAAPLEVIAELSEHVGFASALKDALDRQTAKRTDDVTPMELVRMASEELVLRGARHYITAEQLRCELALMPESMLLRDGPSVPEDLAVLKDTRWLGKALMALDIRKSNASSRLRLYGVYNRWYDLSPTFVAEVLESRTEADDAPAQAYPGTDTRHALAYCETNTCARCSYASVCNAVMPEVHQAKKQADPQAGR